MFPVTHYEGKHEEEAGGAAVVESLERLGYAKISDFGVDLEVRVCG